jgi:5-methyltetrahydropteroyltriglutamate--homocysteine methyltransferase
VTDTGIILSTTAGSLPLLPEQGRLGELLEARALGQPVDAAEFAALAAQVVDEMVARQQGDRIDVISNGEADRYGFIDTSRLTGFNGPQADFAPRDLVNAGMITGLLSIPGVAMPLVNDGPVRHKPEVIAAELDRYRRALAAHGVRLSRAFLPEPSPGVITAQGSRYYQKDEEFLDVVTEAMSAEYRAVTDAGITVQIDAPELFVGWFTWYRGDVAGYRRWMQRRVDAINAATEGCPAELVRVHACHGNWPGPHDLDIALPEVIDVLYGLRARTLVLETANPRHRWERRIFRRGEHPLPDGKVLAAGVIDSCSWNAGHAETVADDLVLLAGIVGDPGRLMAATDCGYASMPGMHAHPGITNMQLRTLAEGTRLANERLARAEISSCR